MAIALRNKDVIMLHLQFELHSSLKGKVYFFISLGITIGRIEKGLL